MITSGGTKPTMPATGLTFIATACPKCGRPMYKRPCPCRLNRQKWATCAQCVKCGNIIGVRKKGQK